MILETLELALRFQVFEFLNKNASSTAAKSDVFDAATPRWVCGKDWGLCQDCVKKMKIETRARSTIAAMVLSRRE